VTFGADDLVASAEALTRGGQWRLMLPSLAEALVHGTVDDAFDDGEHIHVETVTVALLMMSTALAQRLAQVRGPPEEIVEQLLLRQRAT
jgi:hypothetical protein